MRTILDFYSFHSHDTLRGIPVDFYDRGRVRVKHHSLLNGMGFQSPLDNVWGIVYGCTDPAVGEYFYTPLSGIGNEGISFKAIRSISLALQEVPSLMFNEALAMVAL